MRARLTVSLVKITFPKLISLCAKKPWPRVKEWKRKALALVNTVETKGQEEKCFAGQNIFPSQARFSRARPVQHPSSPSQQCGRLAQKAASSAGHSLLATAASSSIKTEENWRLWLENWRLAENLRFPALSWGGLVRDLIRMHTERPTPLSLQFHIGLKW